MSATTNEIYQRDFELRGIWTESQADTLFTDILKKKGAYDEFALSFDTSDQSLMKELTKSFSVVLTHLLENKRDSMWLHLVQTIEQAYDIVRFYDYSIARYKSPTLQVRYKGSETIVLHRGDIVGTYKDYDIICTEKIMYLEYNDLKTFSIGKMFTLEKEVLADSVGDTILNLVPSTLTSIDNKNLWVRGAGGEDVPITKFMTKYIEETAVRDLSLDNKSTSLYLRNDDKGFGVPDVFDSVTNKCHVTYMETDGILSSLVPFDIEEKDIDWSDSFSGKVTYTSLSYLGFNGDTLSSLKAHAPLVSTTGGFAHSLLDYQYLSKNIPELYDTEAYKDLGLSPKKHYSIPDLGVETSITIENVLFTIQPDGLIVFKETVEKTFPAYRVTLESLSTFALHTDSYLVYVKDSALQGIDYVSESDGVKKPCCTVMVPYIKQNYYLGLDTNTQLTVDEKVSVTLETETFKGFSSEVLYYPATETPLVLDFIISVDDRVLDYPLLENSIQEVISEYNYKIGSEIIVPEVVARVSQVMYEGVNKNNFNAISTCKVQDLIKDKVYTPAKDEYYFLSATVTYTNF